MFQILRAFFAKLRASRRLGGQAGAEIQNLTGGAPAGGDAAEQLLASIPRSAHVVLLMGTTGSGKTMHVARLVAQTAGIRTGHQTEADPLLFETRLRSGRRDGGREDATAGFAAVRSVMVASGRHHPVVVVDYQGSYCDGDTEDERARFGLLTRYAARADHLVLVVSPDELSDVDNTQVLAQRMGLLLRSFRSRRKNRIRHNNITLVCSKADVLGGGFNEADISPVSADDPFWEDIPKGADITERVGYIERRLVESLSRPTLQQAVGACRPGLRHFFAAILFSGARSFDISLSSAYARPWGPSSTQVEGVGVTEPFIDAVGRSVVNRRARFRGTVAACLGVVSLLIWAMMGSSLREASRRLTDQVASDGTDPAGISVAAEAVPGWLRSDDLRLSATLAELRRAHRATGSPPVSEVEQLVSAATHALADTAVSPTLAEHVCSATDRLVRERSGVFDADGRARPSSLALEGANSNGGHVPERGALALAATLEGAESVCPGIAAAANEIRNAVQERRSTLADLETL